MNSSQSERVYRLMITGLGTVALIVLIAVGAVFVAIRPPTAQQIAATLTALPPPPATATPTPTPIPPVPGTSPELLVCQREAGRAMNARDLVGAVNLSDDHALSMNWVSTDAAILGLDDALPGIVRGLEAALEIWDQGCALYDRVEIDVYDGPRDRQTQRLRVKAQIDDLLKWHAGEYGEQELVARLEVEQPLGARPEAAQPIP
ncbi:MAG: hypothetical protein ACK2VD_22180 [Anaerolineae bacterium]